MSKSADYNRGQLGMGLLTVEHVTELVTYWQGQHGLTPDGLAGPKTIESIGAAMAHHGVLELPPFPAKRCYPLRALPDGRMPQVTSRHRIHNPERATHYGADLFYRYDPDKDPPMKVGDGGRTARWWIPDNTIAVAQADGKVVLAGASPTGYRVWIEHEHAWLTGGFHFTSLLVAAGQVVTMGQSIGVVGDNPRDNDARHLHSELYLGDLSRYPSGTQDPERWWSGAEVLSAL